MMNERQMAVALLAARERGTEAFVTAWGDPLALASRCRVLVRVRPLEAASVVFLPLDDGAGVLIDEGMNMRDGFRAIALAIAHTQHDAPCAYAILKSERPDAPPPCPHARVENAFVRGYLECVEARGG